MNIPDGILCSKTHEWVAQINNETLIGLSDIAIKHFGDIVFIELPEVGTKYTKNEVFATFETVKLANEMYMPIGGEIIEINEDLINSPEKINEEPFESWLIKVKPNNFIEDSQALMDYNDYKEDFQ